MSHPFEPVSSQSSASCLYAYCLAEDNSLGGKEPIARGCCPFDRLNDPLDHSSLREPLRTPEDFLKEAADDIHEFDRSPTPQDWTDRLGARPGSPYETSPEGARPLNLFAQNGGHNDQDI